MSWCAYHDGGLELPCSCEFPTPPPARQERDFGPNITTARRSPDTVCPVCGDTVPAESLVTHGAEHRARG